MPWMLIALVVSTVVMLVLTPKPPTQTRKPASLEDFDVPVAEDGRAVPWIFGEGEIKGYNVVYYGDLGTEPIKISGGGKK